jgi:hypothetical protein
MVASSPKSKWELAITSDIARNPLLYFHCEGVLMLKKVILYSGALLSLSGCAGLPKLSDEAKKGRIVKADPPKNCEDLGTVSSMDMPMTWTGANDDEVNDYIRFKTNEKGGNYFRWDLAKGIMKKGTAFKCP